MNEVEDTMPGKPQDSIEQEMQEMAPFCVECLTKWIEHGLDLEDFDALWPILARDYVELKQQATEGHE